MEISTRNKVQPAEVKRLDRPASGLAAPTKNTTPKVREVRSVRTEQVRQEQQQLKQQQAAAQQPQKIGLLGIASRISNSLRLGIAARLGSRQVADEVTKEELAEYKTIEQKMAERGPDKREMALRKHHESQTQQGVIREQLRNSQVSAPAGYLEALEAEIEALEEGEEELDSIDRAKVRANLPKSARLSMSHGRVLANASILLGLLPKAVEKWLELVAQGKKAGPTLREMKQLSRF